MNDEDDKDLLVQLAQDFKEMVETVPETSPDFWKLSPEEEEWMAVKNKAMTDLLNSFALPPPATVDQKVANRYLAQKDPWLKRILLIMD